MIYHATVVEFTKMLNNLSALLDKAAQFSTERKCDVSVLLSDRLAPDQFNFTKQVQIACDHAKGTVALLANKEAPAHPDDEKTLEDLKARIEKTISFLAQFKDSDFDGALTRRISRPRWEGKTLSGEDFLMEYAIPNFYFHVTTAYAILRHNGVQIGKKDYLGALPYQN